jgi:hypothetical protein
LVAAIFPRLQGILITGVGMAVFVVAMLLMPRLKPDRRTGGAQFAAGAA